MNSLRSIPLTPHYFSRKFSNLPCIPLIWIYLPENTGTSTEESSEEEEDEDEDEGEEEEVEDSGELLAWVVSLFPTASLLAASDLLTLPSLLVFQQRPVLRGT